VGEVEPQQKRKGEYIMALLSGNVKSMRVVEGTYKTGKRQGVGFEFLALEIVDEHSGAIWSCQMDSQDEQYAQVARGNSLVKHKVEVVVMGQTAGERDLPNGQKVMQIRSQITEVQDKGPVSVRRSA